MPLFEIVILEVPEKKKDEKQKLEKLVFGPKYVIASDDKSAAHKTLIENAAELQNLDMDRIQVLVRPF